MVGSVARRRRNDPPPSPEQATGYGTWIVVGVVFYGLSAIWWALFWRLEFLAALGLLWDLITAAIVIAGCRETYERRRVNR